MAALRVWSFSARFDSHCGSFASLYLLTMAMGPREKEDLIPLPPLKLQESPPCVSPSRPDRIAHRHYVIQLHRVNHHASPAASTTSSTAYYDFQCSALANLFSLVSSQSILFLKGPKMFLASWFTPIGHRYYARL